jgi:hypothetical protein
VPSDSCSAAWNDHGVMLKAIAIWGDFPPGSPTKRVVGGALDIVDGPSIRGI